MAIVGVGTVFGRKADSGSNYETIAEITNISGPGMSRDTIDTTTLDTTGGYRTFITGFRDGGTFELTMNYTSAGYQKLLADFQSDTPKEYKVTLKDTSSVTFSGLVTDIPIDIPEDLVTVTTTIKISGVPTFDFPSGV